MLITKNLSFSINQKELIHKISLEIKKGSFVGLIGPNGSGKSTLLKTIYRANKVSEGTVYLDGKNMERMSNKEMARQLAVVTQENDINFDFTVMELMMIGRYAHHSAFSKREYQDEKRCKESLKNVGMEGFEQRSFLSLSGGEKQRVLIASALSREAKMIILDEPINHLDVGYQFQIMDILKRQKEATIFTSVHDMNMALRYCDYIVALHHGEVAAFGKPEEVLTEALLSELFRVRAKVCREENGELYIKYLGGLNG